MALRIFVAVLALGAAPDAAAQTALALHRPIERVFGPERKVDTFAVTAAAGEFVQVMVAKRGVDVLVRVLDPSRELVVTANSPNGAFGPQPVGWIANVAGIYTLEVEKGLVSADRESYEIELTALRRSSRRDRREILAERTFYAAAVKGRIEDRESRVAAVRMYEKGVRLWKKLGNRYEEGLCLHLIGVIDYRLGEPKEALEYYKRALQIRQETADRVGEGATLVSIGAVYWGWGESQKALNYYQQGLAIKRMVGDRLGEAAALNNIGIAYASLSELQKSLEFFQDSIRISREIGDHTGEAAALHGIAHIYSDLGQNRKALDSEVQALGIWRAVGDRTGEAKSLNSLADLYGDLGELDKAVRLYGRSLSIKQAVGDRAGQAVTLNNIASTYFALGDHKQALEYFQRALPIYGALSDPVGEAEVMHNIGGIYSLGGDKMQALDYYNRSLKAFQAAGNREREAGMLATIGYCWSDLGDRVKGVDLNGQALAMFRAIRDAAGEAMTLVNLGDINSAVGEKQKALEFYNQALQIYRAIEDRQDEALTLNDLSRVLQELHVPDTAIWVGKQAVNVLQGVRRDNRSLSEDLQRSYSGSIESTYRHLASLLVERQRFEEAEEVLNLLKDKEASDFIRRDAVTDQLKATVLLPEEKAALERYEQILGDIIARGQRKSVLLAKAAKEPLSAAERMEEDQLDSDQKAANKVLLTFLREQEKTAMPGSAISRRTEDFRDAASVQSSLRVLGPDTAAIYTLVMPDRYIAMLVTSGSRKVYTTTIQERELNKKVFEFRQRLQDPHSDPIPLAQELYRIVFPEGLRQDLESIRAQTIMWSIDGTLRYIPVAALHDGHGYLVERFCNSLITPASLTHLTADAPPQWRGVGFGVSEAKAEFTALPSVPEELHGIFRQGQTGTEPIPGVIRLNSEFTQTSFKNELRQPNKNVVHIATHFVSRPGVAANSRLLLGDGTELSLADIEAEEQLFDGVDLLTLSACSTAFTNRSEDGREVDSFGTIAQREGAKGVIASLWSVNDEATARLMTTMYRLRQQNPALGKGEALRQAQAQMVAAVLHPDDGAASERGIQPGQATPRAPVARYAWKHPFYWAPFILIGNWK